MLPLVGPHTKLLKKRNDLKHTLRLQMMLSPMYLCHLFHCQDFVRIEGKPPPKEGFISLKMLLVSEIFLNRFYFRGAFAPPLSKWFSLPWVAPLDLRYENVF